MFMLSHKKEKRIETLRTIAGLLAVCGMGIMAYLSSLHFSGGSSVCDFGKGLSCSTVNQSAYSDILGVPLSGLGFVYFAAIAFLLFWRRLSGVFTWALLASVFSLAFGIYLSAIEHTVLHSICLFCELSKVVMIAIIGISVVGAKQSDEDVPFEWVAWIVVLALIFSYGTWMLQHVP